MRRGGAVLVVSVESEEDVLLAAGVAELDGEGSNVSSRLREK
jgi:hypothetical protein